MQSPLQIVFRDVDHSDAVEERIREKVEMLEKHSDKIVSCRVTVSAPHKSQTKGKLYDIRLDIGLPGEEIVVTKSHNGDHAHEDGDHGGGAELEGDVTAHDGEHG